eukprot:GGOE01005776.1.p1 GENE.GGOE01005776.1~~GGOE01005776.1.p1  ORF type:complete len:449 (-),score=105.98 GGOE01005776.1:650-1867(-)
MDAESVAQYLSGKLSIDSNVVGVEKAMTVKEAKNCRTLARHRRMRKVELRGYFHVSKYQPFWQEIITEQLQLLDGRRPNPELNVKRTRDDTVPWDLSQRYTSLLKLSSGGLYLNVVGSDEGELQKVKAAVDALNLTHRKKIEFDFHRGVFRDLHGAASPQERQRLDADKGLSCGEITTLHEMHAYCSAKVHDQKQAFVYYLHSKGGCCGRSRVLAARDRQDNNDAVVSWREYMNAFNIEFPSICWRALLQGYSTCGVDNQDRHYSGNFWWANCYHVAQLPLLPHRFNYASAEFFVLDTHTDGFLARELGRQCGYSTYGTNKNMYLYNCRRDEYRRRLFEKVMGELGPSNNHPPRPGSGSATPSGNTSDFDRDLPHLKVCKDFMADQKRYRHEPRESEVRRWYYGR